MLNRILLSLLFISTFITAGRSQCFLVPSEVCIGDCGPVFYLQNDPPGTTYQWSINCGTITNDTVANPHTACFQVAGTCMVQVIIVIPGEDPDTCTAIVEVLPHSLSVIMESVCPDDSIEINGTYYTPGFYTDTIFGGASNTCDSILLITVNEIPLDTTLETYQGCEGDGYAVVVNGATYDEANPSGLEILPGSDGCDSIVIIDLVFLPPTFAEIIYIGCEGDSFSVVVNSVLYNELHPTGVEVLVGSNGCDSIVTITLTFIPVHRDTISYTGCSGDGFSIIVGGIEYNESNPSGSDTVIGGCDTIITIDLQFDTLNATLTLEGNQLCAAPAGMQYTWMTCDSIFLPDTTECITVSGSGCACVIVDTGTCTDTICLDYLVCELTCQIVSPSAACVGDSIQIIAQSNGSDSSTVTLTVTLDSLVQMTFSGDTVVIPFDVAGCYTIDLVVEENGCQTSCSDTICIFEKPLADLCCSDAYCDSAYLDITLFGAPPFTIAITDGTTIDTISGIMSSQYEHQVFPPFFENTLYQLLWVQDSAGYCNGNIIHDSAYVYLISKPEIEIIRTGDTLCIEPAGFAYNWTNCETPATVSPGRCFIPDSSGCYCAHITTQVIGCADMECIDFVLTSTSEPSNDQISGIWYQPDQHSIAFRYSGNHQDELRIQLFDLQGRLVYFSKAEQIDVNLFSISLPHNVPSFIIATIIASDVVYSRGMYVRT